MNQETKKLIWLGIGLIFFVTMVALPVGIIYTNQSLKFLEANPCATTPKIAVDSPYVGFDFAFLSWDGTISLSSDFVIEPK